MPSFKPVYLIHGDDHGRIAERRARLRSLAEKASGAQGLEIFEGDRATPQEVAASLSMMTFALGRRFLIVDGVERWKDKDLEPLEAALAAIGPDTTIALFAREDGRAKASSRLHDAVRAAGGEVSAEVSVKPWELPKWLVAQARGLELELDSDAARTLIHQVGDRQQRLMRELEKLALALEQHPLSFLAPAVHLVGSGGTDRGVDRQVGDLLGAVGSDVASSAVLRLAGRSLAGLLAGRPLPGQLDLAHGEEVLRGRRRL